MSRRRLALQNRLLLLALLCAIPAWVAASIALYFWDAAEPLRWTVFVAITLFMIVVPLVMRQRVVRPLQALANMLEALREGDYSLRGRNADARDAFGEVMIEVNTLSRTLHDQRLGDARGRRAAEQDRRRGRHRGIRVRRGAQAPAPESRGRVVARGACGRSRRPHRT